MGNSTAIAYINCKGGTHSRVLSDLAIEIWEWCLNRKVMVTAEHIVGIENVRADQESRMFQDPRDRKLKKAYFLKILSKWSRPEVDLFTARHNCQL